MARTGVILIGDAEAGTVVKNHAVMVFLPSRDEAAAAILDRYACADADGLPAGAGADRLRRIPLGSAVVMVGVGRCAPEAR